MPRHDLILPDLGLGDQPIALSLWLVREGSFARESEQLVEVLAGAVTVDLPSPVDGILVETLAEEGERISVGQRLAVVEDSEVGSGRWIVDSG
jgi:pyruvate/2-oxoglutarate dehydrogenase complex dihydrolipoamide acyltransferase (E2) component